MTDDESSAIEQFFAVADRLKSLSVVRSDKYLGDIAEFICKDQFGIELASSGRQPGYDGHYQGGRVQIKQK